MDEYLEATIVEFDKNFSELLEACEKANNSLLDLEDEKAAQDKAWKLFEEFRPALWI